MNLQRMRQLRGEYEKALEAILTGQSYSIEGLNLTRADFEKVKKALYEIDSVIEHEELRMSGLGRSRIRYVVPRDGINGWRIRRISNR